MTTIDGRRARGDASRRVVLAAAVDLASVEGLDGLSIGRLATAAQVSKSGVATLFGSKERLQLAAIEAARERFIEVVVQPARAQPRGLGRVIALFDYGIAYSRDRVFPGGCFFTAAASDFHAKPGPVRDALTRVLDERAAYIAASVRYAIDLGELSGLLDSDQFAFEFTALEDAANTRSVMTGSNEPYGRARSAFAARLVALGADPAAVAPLLDVDDEAAAAR